MKDNVLYSIIVVAVGIVLVVFLSQIPECMSGVNRRMVEIDRQCHETIRECVKATKMPAACYHVCEK